MRLAEAWFVFGSAALIAPPTYAEVICPQELRWSDAAYAQRTVTIEGHSVNAIVEAFVNASVIHLDIDGLKSAVIYLPALEDKEALHVTLGADRPKPNDFTEISMAVEPPMSSGDWPRMKSPCAIPDKVTIDFDERDLPAQALLKFRGTVRRDGLRISYTMAIERGETWQGELIYAHPAQDFDVHTDVQGWHVFRANSYVETLPIGKPVPLLSLIKKR